MRNRMKSGVVYHAEPESSKCFLSKAEVLNNKLKRGNISPEEMEWLASYNVEHRKTPKERKYFIMVFGKPMKVTKQEYANYYNL